MRSSFNIFFILRIFAPSTGGAFTKADLFGSHIIYQHNGDEVTTDRFKLDVSDGMHTIPITVRITVLPIDDELPLLARAHDGTLNFSIEVYERDQVIITPDVRAMIFMG